MEFNVKFQAHDVGLCGKCRYSHIASDGNRIEAWCSFPMNDRRIKFRVEECNEFADRTSKSQHEFEEIGWVLEMSKGQIKGFAPPKRSDD